MFSKSSVTNREDSRHAGVDVIWLRQPRPAQLDRVG